MKKIDEFIVAGAGIGGLAAALAMAKQGFEVLVLERAKELGEIGYGLQIGPNAYRMLDILGVAKQIEQTAYHPKNLALVDMLDGAGLSTISLDENYVEHFAAPYLVLHRRDLHAALAAACIESGRVSIMTAKEVSSFESTGVSVKVRCADNSEYIGRGLIGADGLRSRIREAIVGDGPPRFSGHTSFRGVIPIEQIRNNNHLDDMTCWVGPNTHLIQYRLRGGAVMNVVATVADLNPTHSVDHEISPAELQQAFSHACPEAQSLLQHVDSHRGFKLYDREPTRGWTNGNVTLLGDAAHPTLQYLAQGACMAIEDAMVLAKSLVDADGDCAKAFAAYSQSRYLRTAKVQIYARVFGEIIHCGGSARDVRNDFLSARPRGSYREVDWLHRGIAMQSVN